MAAEQDEDKEFILEWSNDSTSNHNETSRGIRGPQSRPIDDMHQKGCVMSSTKQSRHEVELSSSTSKRRALDLDDQDDDFFEDDVLEV